jgi:hypothetical protein
MDGIQRLRQYYEQLLAQIAAMPAEEKENNVREAREFEERFHAEGIFADALQHGWVISNGDFVAPSFAPAFRRNEEVWRTVHINNTQLSVPDFILSPSWRQGGHSDTLPAAAAAATAPVAATAAAASSAKKRGWSCLDISKEQAFQPVAEAQKHASALLLECQQSRHAHRYQRRMEIAEKLLVNATASFGTQAQRAAAASAQVKLPRAPSPRRRLSTNSPSSSSPHSNAFAQAIKKAKFIHQIRNTGKNP